MFKPTPIEDKVKKSLFNKAAAMNRERVDVTDFNTFIKSSLEPQDNSNPIKQHIYRGCFAKASVAVPEFNSDESDIIQKPTSISSYIGQKGNITSQKNKPLTFLQGFEESSDNRFLGESGITSISVAQQEYYTNKFTIGWVCPDPVFFEEVFEPSFLKLGGYIAIEFGWSNDDSDMNSIPALSIEEMKRLVNQPGRLTERNLISSNYYCGVGTITKFDWKIQDSGIYAGDIQVLSMGANPFLEGTQATSNSADTIPVRNIKNTLETQTLADKLLKDKTANLTEEDREELKKSLVSATKIKEALQANSVAFNLAIKNLDTVADYFLDKEGTESQPFYTDKDMTKYNTAPYRQGISYRYNNGLIRVDVRPSFDVEPEEERINMRNGEVENRRESTPSKYPPKDYLKNRYFMNWGWFEDNILKTYFEMKSGDDLVQTVDSRKATGQGKNNLKWKLEPNKCQTTEYLYSLGLDSVILPGKTQPLLTNGLTGITDKILKGLIDNYYPIQQRVDIDRTRLLFNLLDEKFPKFVGGQDRQVDSRDLGYTANTDSLIDASADGKVTDDERKKMDEENIISTDKKYGIIRNMVFPIKMFQTHFQNTPSLRQGLRNFWADVTNQYGGYWGFELGQDGDNQSHVGVFDSYYANEKPNDTDKLSTPSELQGIFEFSVFSKNSIIKSFDVNLDMSAEAATLARYGGFAKANTGTTKINGKKELGLEAWNILTSTKEQNDIRTLADLKRFREIQNKGYTELRYTSDDSANFMQNDKLKKTLSEDERKIIEKVETQRTRFVQGIGCYDNRGNFSQYFKQTMLYLINYSDLENSGSNISTGRILLPVSISMTLDGISGLKVGNIFKVDYLPENYRKFCYFQIMSIDHKITTSGWDTDIEAIMKMDMSKYWEESGRKLNSGLENYIEVFKLNDIPELDVDQQTALLLAFGQGVEDEFDELKLFNNLEEKIAEIRNRTLERNIYFRTTKQHLQDKFDELEKVKDELKDFFNVVGLPTNSIFIQEKYDKITNVNIDELDNVPFDIPKKVIIGDNPDGSFNYTPVVGGAPRT